MRDKFGLELKTWRTKSGKSMGDVARFLDCSVTYISDVERGVRTPLTPENIMKVSRLLNIPAHGVDALLHAAAEWRGSYELHRGSPEQNQAAAALMRGWSTLGPEELKRIEEIAISRRAKTGEHPVVKGAA